MDAGSYAVIGIIAATTTAVVLPFAGRLATRLGLLVAPDNRGVHSEAIPAAGGIAMLAGVISAASLAKFAINGLSDNLSSSVEVVGVIAAAVMIFSVGVVDDIRDIPPWVKIAGIAPTGLLLALTGMSIDVFRIPFYDLLFLSGVWSVVMTMLWVMGMANVVNLIDGLDGLAAGIIAIAAGSFLLYSLRLVDLGMINADNPGPVWAAIAFGVSVGFLPYNFHPARVFMGDGGALLLGLLMAASTISVGGRLPEKFSGQAFFFYAPLFIPLVILGVPIADTVFAVVRRAMRRRKVWMPDKEHLHHRLMRLGHGHRRSVLILWLWTALLSAFVLYPTYTGRGDAIVPAGIAALALFLYTLFRPRLSRQKAQTNTNGDSAASLDNSIDS
ncbi:MAG: MraY family glycosyltransferase [Acidimicrobiaceae bacterium]|nr:MraY family glycosyltransferase [Acidimicrobiaceae bacterium]